MATLASAWGQQGRGRHSGVGVWGCMWVWCCTRVVRGAMPPAQRRAGGTAATLCQHSTFRARTPFTLAAHPPAPR